VDPIGTMVVSGDPSLHNTLPTIGNPTHIAHPVVEDGMNIQPRLEYVYKEEEKLCQSDVVSKPVGIWEYPGPSIVH
jgi:hypothetical protein